MGALEAFVPLDRFFGGLGAALAWAAFETLLALGTLGAALVIALVVKVIRRFL